MKKNVQPVDVSFNIYADYSPEEALNVISQFFDSKNINDHKKVLWDMFMSALCDPENNRTWSAPTTPIQDFACEVEALTSLLIAVHSLYGSDEN